MVADDDPGADYQFETGNMKSLKTRVALILIIGIGICIYLVYPQTNPAEKQSEPIQPVAQKNVPSNTNSHRILTQDLPPWSYAGESGIIVDIINEIEKRIGTNVKIESLPWSRAQKMTQIGDNFLSFPLARVPKRENKYVWVIDVMPSDLVFATLDGKPMDMDMARRAKKIIVQQDTPPEYFLRANNFLNIDSVTKSASIPKMLHLNRGDAWFGDMNVTKSTVRNTPYEQRMTYGPSVKNNHIYLGASLNISKTLVDKYSRTFNEIKQDGTYARIMKRYLEGGK